MSNFIVCALHHIFLGNGARMDEMRTAYKILVKILKVRELSQDLGVDGRKILKLMLEE